MSKTTKITEQQLAILDEAFPVEVSERKTYPRLGMLSKDIISEKGTGKNKKITVEQAAGTFYVESDQGEVNSEGKKVWTKEFIDGDTIDVNIVFARKQLRRFDSSLNKFISSPVYDNADQVIPLFLDKQIIKTGTPAFLQSCYPALTQKGKPTSDLKEETILYVLYNGELHQMNLSQSSKWTFKDYKKYVNPSSVITTLGTVEETFGTNTYRKLTFTSKGLIDGDQFDKVNESQEMLKETVENDNQMFLAAGDEVGTPEERLKKF